MKEVFTFQFFQLALKNEIFKQNLVSGTEDRLLSLRAKL
jgi:hypothetical protein